MIIILLPLIIILLVILIIFRKKIRLLSQKIKSGELRISLGLTSLRKVSQQIFIRLNSYFSANHFISRLNQSLLDFTQKKWVSRTIVLIRKNSKYLFLMIIFVVLFYNLKSLPTSLDDCVGDAIRPPVEKVFDHLKNQPDITWIWQDMDQSNVGKSPIFAAITEIGLRIFGLNNFGVRVIHTLLSFLVLIFAFFLLKKNNGTLFATIFISLLVSAPWYLTVARSGGGIGFALNLFILSVGMLYLLLQEKKSIIIPIIAGLSVAILPYGYAILRLYPPLIIVWAILNLKKNQISTILNFYHSYTFSSFITAYRS